MALRPFELETQSVPFEVLIGNGEKEFLSNTSGVLIVGAHSQGSHKLKRIREFSSDKLLSVGTNGDRYLLPIMTTSACPSLLEEETFNGTSELDASLTAVMKAEQVRVRQGKGDDLEALIARRNFIAGVLGATEGMEQLSSEEFESLIESIFSRGIVITTSTDVMVDVVEHNRWRPLAKPKPGIGWEEIETLLHKAIGKDGSEMKMREGRLRVGLAAKVLTAHGKWVNVGVSTGLKTYFWYRPMNTDEIVKYIKSIGLDDLCKTNGGLYWHEHLQDRIIQVSHDDRPDEDETTKRKQMSHRLLGAPPELFDLVGELVTLVASGKYRGVKDTSELPGMFQAYFGGAFAETAATWREIPNLSRRTEKFHKMTHRDSARMH